MYSLVSTSHHTMFTSAHSNAILPSPGSQWPRGHSSMQFSWIEHIQKEHTHYMHVHTMLRMWMDFRIWLLVLLVFHTVHCIRAVHTVYIVLHTLYGLSTACIWLHALQNVHYKQYIPVCIEYQPSGSCPDSSAQSLVTTSFIQLQYIRNSIVHTYIHT